MRDRQTEGFRALEERLLTEETRSSPHLFESLIAEDFLEFGSSGRTFCKRDVLDAHFYATSPGHAFPLRKMIIIALGPLVIISTVAPVVALLVPALAGYLAVVFIGNTAGAIGDVWTLACSRRTTRRLPRAMDRVDHRRGAASGGRVGVRFVGASGEAQGATAEIASPPASRVNAVQWL